MGMGMGWDGDVRSVHVCNKGKRGEKILDFGGECKVRVRVGVRVQQFNSYVCIVPGSYLINWKGLRYAAWSYTVLVHNLT